MIKKSNQKVLGVGLTPVCGLSDEGLTISTGYRIGMRTTGNGFIK